MHWAADCALRSTSTLHDPSSAQSYGLCPGLHLRPQAKAAGASAAFGGEALKLRSPGLNPPRSAEEQEALTQHLAQLEAALREALEEEVRSKAELEQAHK